MKSGPHWFYGPVGQQSISSQECAPAMRAAVISACYGTLASVVLSDSGIVILYAAKLNAGPFAQLCATSLERLASFFLLFPVAYWMQKVGVKRIMLPAVLGGAAAFIAAAAAPWCGAWGKFLLLAGLVVFAISMAIYAAGWFPLLRDVVPGNERGRFFGRLRVSWQLAALLFIIASTFLIGKDASFGVLQAIIAVAGLALVGRYYYLRQIPEKAPERGDLSFAASFRVILGNAPLIGFSVYCFWLYFFAGATLPVTIVFCKFNLKIMDDLIIALSFCYMAGAIVGYSLAGRFVDRFGTKSLFLIAHFAFGLVNALYLFAHDKTPATLVLIFSLVFCYGVCFAAASVAVSSETFALVSDRLKNLSLALCFCMYCAGLGLSRFVAGWVLDKGALAASWQAFGTTLTQYHSLFLIYAFGVTISCVLLTLVPAVVRKMSLLPGD